MSESTDHLIAYCRQDGRVCPQPIKWDELFEMLPEKRRVGGGWEPCAPLILGAWWEACAESKKQVLAEHVLWAEKHDCLDEVGSYLRGLREEDWYHGD